MHDSIPRRKLRSTSSLPKASTRLCTWSRLSCWSAFWRSLDPIRDKCSHSWAFTDRWSFVSCRWFCWQAMRSLMLRSRYIFKTPTVNCQFRKWRFESLLLMEVIRRWSWMLTMVLLTSVRTPLEVSLDIRQLIKFFHTFSLPRRVAKLRRLEATLSLGLRLLRLVITRWQTSRTFHSVLTVSRQSMVCVWSRAIAVVLFSLTSLVWSIRFGANAFVTSETTR